MPAVTQTSLLTTSGIYVEIPYSHVIELCIQKHKIFNPFNFLLYRMFPFSIDIIISNFYYHFYV